MCALDSANRSRNMGETWNFKHELQQAVSDKQFPELFKLYYQAYIQPLADAPSQVVNRRDLLSIVDLTPKQYKMLEAMWTDKLVAILGSRKTGKTFVVALAAVWLALEEPKEVHVLSSKKQTASYVVQVVEEIVTQVNPDLLRRQAKTHCELMNGSKFMAHSNTLADTGTYEADVLILDEAQEITEEVWAKVMPQLATGREMYCWIVGTAKAGTPFYDFWHNPETEEQFDIFTLFMKDATWVDQATWDSIAMLMSDRMVRQELGLEWVEDEQVFFPSDAIEKAYRDFPHKPAKQYGEIVSGVDFGMGHETSIITIAWNPQQRRMEMLDVWGMHNPTDKQILAHIQRLDKEYGSTFILEQSPLGAFVRREIYEMNVNSRGSTFTQHKEDYLASLYVALVKEKLLLTDRKLKSQLLQYDGSKKNDDRVDALLHAVHYLFKKHLRYTLDNFTREMNTCQ